MTAPGSTFRALALGIALCGGIAEAQAPIPREVRIQRITQHYDVEGDDARALLRAMREKGPAQRGRRFFARNEWSIRWHYRTTGDRADCRLRDFTVELASITTLPRWRPSANADTLLIRQWTAFLGDLVEHEQGHENHGIGAARDIVTLFRSYRYDCHALRNELGRRAREIIQHYAGKDIEYDRETAHGIRRGAVWPPPGAVRRIAVHGVEGRCLTSGPEAEGAARLLRSLVSDTTEVVQTLRSHSGLPVGLADEVVLVDDDAVCNRAASVYYGDLGVADPQTPLIVVRAKSVYVVMDPLQREEMMEGRIFNADFSLLLGLFGM